jgi:hypothetical protein
MWPEAFPFLAVIAALFTAHFGPHRSAPLFGPLAVPVLPNSADILQHHWTPALCSAVYNVRTW